jgi:hypothetical protein
LKRNLDEMSKMMMMEMMAQLASPLIPQPRLQTLQILLFLNLLEEEFALSLNIILE